MHVGEVDMDDDNGTLAGILDWSAAGIGDPACGAMLGLAMPAPARAVYRQAPGFD